MFWVRYVSQCLETGRSKLNHSAFGLAWKWNADCGIESVPIVQKRPLMVDGKKGRPRAPGLWPIDRRMKVLLKTSANDQGRQLCAKRGTTRLQDYGTEMLKC